MCQEVDLNAASENVVQKRCPKTVCKQDIQLYIFRLSEILGLFLVDPHSRLHVVFIPVVSIIVFALTLRISQIIFVHMTLQLCNIIILL
jgi:hypothetical protein